MRVLVTGASGFVGRVVVRAAAAEHDVVALRRRDSTAGSWPDGVEVIDGDLRQIGPWTAAVGGVDAVIHLAAAASGDLSEQFAGTVTATENLLSALSHRPSVRMVHVSSFSVYDYAGLACGDELDEDTPLEPHPLTRDAYTTTKLLQERLVREACAEAGRSLAVLRPGAIYGPGKDWDCGVAARVGRFGFIVAPLSRMRLTQVDNCAAAIVAAISIADPSMPTVNVVDDDLPTHWSYFRACRQRGLVGLVPIPVPWSFARAIGVTLSALAVRAVGRGAKLPELVAPARQEARWKPLRYSNARAHTSLGWSPTVRLGVALDEMAAR